MWSTVQGVWFDAGQSRANPATLSLNGRSVTVRYGDRSERALLAELDISPRLGNTPRRLSFPGGGLFETQANDAIDRMLTSTGTGHAGWLHWLESKWHIALLLAVPTAACLWFAATSGVPAIARLVAAQLPDSVTRAIGEQVTGSLDEFGFEATQLTQRERAFLNGEFARLTAQLRMGEHCELRFYASPASIGPNAFAVPPCIVVFTDELVKLAKTDDELYAVLVHELGHIEHRHTLRHVVQGALLAFILVAITGDATQISSAVASVPLIFVELGFSREFEREADRFAHRLMRDEGVPLRAFPDILLRMETYWQEHSPFAGDEEEAGWSRYLSTHPTTEERAALFKTP